MRVKAWWALVSVGLVGCGGVEPETGVDVAPAEGTVQAQACAPGVAVKVKDVIAPGTPPPPPGLQSPYGLSELQGTLFFAVDVLGGQSTLWKSNGTTAGTVPVKEFPSQGTNGYRQLADFTAVSSQLFFTIDDAVIGRELWITNGTTAGTRLVVDLTPGPASTQLSFPAQVGGALSFFRTVSLTPTGSRLELWKSDGTAAGTVRTVDLGTQSTVESSILRADGQRLFFLQDAVNGTRLWRSNGTAGGTVLVKSLDRGTPLVADVRAVGGTTLFTLRDTGPNTEIWKTDGTPAGTVRLETFGHSATLLGLIGSRVYVAYVTADDRVKLASVLLTGGGKTTVTTLPNPFEGQPDPQPFLQEVRQEGNKIYLSLGIFYNGGPAIQASYLWVTDGTAAGTRQLSDQLSQSEDGFSPLFATGSGTLLFGSQAPDDGLEPWVTNGTVAGTGRVANINPDGGSNPQGFTRIGHRIFFVANAGPPGNSLWSMPANVTCLPWPPRPGRLERIRAPPA
ncbi:hypothetical protein OV208_15725 [Corallococcus sp. bb12-1]|uniref:hypothetical protein n=1 Tax=Corallococcus sp. bb12-1 TaxID=2996784 RepID=UPI0022705591|nr:hypothetical protein [Corallococcus sp. bb12-1]MCY1042774.1 hypothetical protein [Corallococcus sp. bb12-1]